MTRMKKGSGVDAEIARMWRPPKRRIPKDGTLAKKSGVELRMGRDNGSGWEDSAGCGAEASQAGGGGRASHRAKRRHGKPRPQKRANRAPSITIPIATQLPDPESRLMK